MLMVLKPGKEPMAEAIFRKWELDFAVIGEVTDTGHMVLEFDGKVVCDIPLGPLADDAPLYDRPYLTQDEYKAWANVAPLGDIPESTDIAADLLKLMACPELASRRWIWEQYDSQVGADTLQKSGGDAAVVRIHGTRKALAMTTDCTPRYCYADPVEGGKQAIAEAYRNLCAVGATPLAVTNCLNFGSPQRPEIMAQIVGCLQGMSEACVALDMPIVSGNVSLYNESKATGGGSAILPTPAIGAVGLIEDYSKTVGIGFKAEGDVIFLVGNEEDCILDVPHMGQTLWLREIHSLETGSAPSVDLDLERRAGEFVRELIAQDRCNAVHDVSDGGYVVAVAEMALVSGLGAALGLSEGSPAKERLGLFAENQGLYVIASSREQFEEARLSAYAKGLDCVQIGVVEGTSLAFFEMTKGPDRGLSSIDLADLRAANERFFREWMEG
jgi:phosphoribosylformylglycinamidine synthase